MSNRWVIDELRRQSKTTERGDGSGDCVATSSLLRTAATRLESKTSTCATCKYWSLHSNEWRPNALVEKHDLGFCSEIQQHYYDESAPASLWAIIQRDGEGACLRTAATFGCILHEPKETKS